MARSTRGKRSYFRLVLTTLAMVGAMTAAYANGYLDQANDADVAFGITCGLPNSLFQSFVPGGVSQELTAVELRLLLNSSSGFPGGDVQVRIRRDTIDGPIVGSSFAFVEGVPSTPLVRFDFDPPLHVIPGNTYVIERVVTPVAWSTSGTDSYPQGTAHTCSGEAQVWDFNFNTYHHAVGACCMFESEQCLVTEATNCEDLGGFFIGDGTNCSQVNGCSPIPTTSHWGLIIMASLLLAAGFFVFGKWGQVSF